MRVGAPLLRTPPLPSLWRDARGTACFSVAEERNSHPSKEWDAHAPLGERRRQRGLLDLSFFRVRPQISCIKVSYDVVGGASLRIQIPRVVRVPKKF